MDRSVKRGGDLEGQVALITGASRGIGRAIAVAFAQAGAAAAVLARSGAELDEVVTAIKAGGGKAYAVLADVTDAADVNAAVAEAERRLGPIDVLVNNAGVLGPIAPFAETDPEAWWRAIEVNLRGPMLTARAVLPGMTGRGRGRIVNVVTGSAPFPYFSGYAAGKTALVRFSECLSAEVRDQGLAVFAMSPGTVRTAMSEHSLNSAEGQRWIPWFRRIFDEGLDLPIERPAMLALALASGRYDRLSGLTVSPHDDLDAIVERLDQVEAEKLYSLRLRALPNPELDRVMAVREAGTRAAQEDLVLEQIIPAPRERVFAAWIDAQAMAEWFIPRDGPARWIAPPTVDPRIGGRITVDVRSGDGDFHVAGTFTEILAGRRLGFRWILAQGFPLGGAGDTDVVIEFLDEGENCRIRLRHTGFANAVVREAHERGWRRCFDGVSRLLEPSAAR
jgi:NAD(P)-dependent dehydrogenase (short-subunit alcohol dehydrogenase family)/uncharacterized protein YndB with AHSA1/START domain